MILLKISLTNFKNYENTEVSFCSGLNCLTGLNGSGKTNILDAIHYLSLTKSAFNSQDSQNIRHDSPFFSIRAEFDKEGKSSKVQCSLKMGEKKQFKMDDQSYEKLSHHIGKIPMVLIVPNDDDLIRDSSETRRKFFDSLISQTDKAYLDDLIRYTHFLKQRNSLLKLIFETEKRDKDLLAKYDEELIALSLKISSKRSAFMKSIHHEFVSLYNFISDSGEKVDISYETKVTANDFERYFKGNLDRDIALQRTTSGIHRDDFLFVINKKPLKKFGSQGQQKSFLISLKLAQFDYIKEHSGTTPILLLDDIFDKLDDLRINQLLQMIRDQKFGQIFLTDARRERTETFLSKLKIESKIFEISENEVSKCD